MSPYFDAADHWGRDLLLRYGMEIGMSRPHRHAILPTEDLPAPLKSVADAVDHAKSGDEAKAAASEFLTLSEEWLP